MSSKVATVVNQDERRGHIAADGENAAPAKKRNMLIIAIPAVVVLVTGAAGYCGYAGIIKIPFIPHKAMSAQAVVEQTQFVKIPELVVNLDAGPDGDSYAKMEAELEVTDTISAAAVNTQMPAIIDLFQTYLRSMRPDDLRGAEGLYRLREALLARANVIVSPAAVQNILFIEMVVQ